MAKAPPTAQFLKSDFPSDGLGSQEALDKLFLPLNGALQATQSALRGGLTWANHNAEVKSITVKTPAGGFATGAPFADYQTTAAQSIPNAAYTVINFDTKVTDTDAAVKVGPAWRWTCPPGKAGVYSVAVSANLHQGATGGEMLLAVFKNNFMYRRIGERNAMSTIYQGRQGAANMYLVPGDYIDIRIYQTQGGSQPLENLAESTWITVTGINLAQASVASCFPINFVTTVKSPKIVLVGQAMDTGAGPPIVALGSPDWIILQNGQISLRNIPNLAPGRTYTVALLVTGG